MLSTLGARSVPIPDHIDSYHLKNEAPSLKDVTPIEYVLEVDDERTRLQKEVDRIIEQDRWFQNNSKIVFLKVIIHVYDQFLGISGNIFQLCNMELYSI